MAEQIFDRTHEEIEDTLTNLISVYTSNKIAIVRHKFLF